MHRKWKSAAIQVPQGLQDRIGRRRRLARSRFDSRVDRVIVHPGDLNGAEGGIDECVRIRARIDGVGIALAMVVDDGCEVAVDRAADRIGANVTRQRIRHRWRSSGACGPGV